MRRVSLNARLAQDAQNTSEIYVALFCIEHSMLDSPVRLSTDPTERLQNEPLMYGTRSTWLDANTVTDPYLFVLASTVLPSDLDDAPAEGNIVLENVDNDIAKLLRSFSDLATIHIAVVLASSPSLVEAEYQNLKITSATINAGEVTLSFSRENVEEEYVPAGRMTKNRFPGLHR
ncbi:hypothetical protein HB780_05420 (plasmid) [Rhizobium lusitanum]|uniref:hypothetical protein n=1 Tax=Rhizobium lusitanum TaxID=293958 RepID=UPI00160DFBE4|nr:hypothetical protein [Rhizobium lusitanum]QND45196.1 hypothetical protein HB780_05420 [Rhizobium lusitanum]